MQLRQAEAFRVLDHHDRRLRHVDADFDHRRCDQYLNIAALERLHDGVLLGALHAAVNKTDGRAKIFL